VGERITAKTASSRSVLTTSDFMNLFIAIPKDREVVGLLGNLNEDSSNDWMFRNGTSIVPNKKGVYLNFFLNWKAVRNSHQV